MLAPPSDIRGLSDCVLVLLNEPDTAERLAEAARRQLTDEFDPAYVLSRHVHIYEDLLQGGRMAKRKPWFS